MISEAETKSTSSKKSDAKENDLNSINIKREKISVGVRQSNGSADTDSSILVIPNEVQIITLSDDDDDNDNNKMPPPMVPAPKKLPAKKTRNASKTSSMSESNSSDASSLLNAEASQLQPKKTRKGKKTKKPVLPIVEIKQEKVADEVGLSNEETSKTRKKSADNSSEKVVPDTGSKNVTMESVYEDASDKILSVSRLSHKMLRWNFTFSIYYCTATNKWTNSICDVCFAAKFDERKWLCGERIESRW